MHTLAGRVQVRRTADDRDRLQAAFEPFFDRRDVLIMPTLAWPCPPARRWGERSWLRSVVASLRFAPMTGVWNMVGFAAASVPCPPTGGLSGFPTKKGLFLELVDRCFRRVQDTFTAAAGDLTGDEALMAMAEAYERLLGDRTLLLLQMQAYAACDDPDIRAATRAGYKRLWELVERLTGLPFQTVVDFFAVGMLMNVAAAMDLASVDERWTSWCPKNSPVF